MSGSPTSPLGRCVTVTTGSCGPVPSSAAGPTLSRPGTATASGTCRSAPTTRRSAPRRRWRCSPAMADPQAPLPQAPLPQAPLPQAPRRALGIPEMALVVLVGVSGSGKSTFARRHFEPFEVLSSDFCRGLVSGDENDQPATRDAFDEPPYIARK